MSDPIVTNENIAADLASVIEEFYKDFPNNSFKDILNGKLALNETLFYELNKLDKNGKLIQKIFLPIAPLNPYVNFADSQVKYGKFYKYNIFAWQLVHGTKYKYRSLASDNVKGKGNAIPALNVLFQNLESSFISLKDVVYNGFNFWEKAVAGSNLHKDFKQFAKEMNQLMNNLVGFKENMTTNSNSVWWRKASNMGNVYSWPESVTGWVSQEGFGPWGSAIAVEPNSGVLSAAAAFCLTPLEVTVGNSTKSKPRAQWIKDILEGNEDIEYTYDQMVKGKQVLGKIVQILDGDTNSFRSIWNYNVEPFENSSTWGEQFQGMGLKQPENPLGLFKQMLLRY